MKNLLGVGAIFLGAVVGFFSLLLLRHSFISALFGLLIAGGLIYFGRNAQAAPSGPITQLSSLPPVPTNFQASFWHKNIALDTASNQIWVRQGGAQTVLSKADIIDWQLTSKTFKGPMMGHNVGNMTVVTGGKQVPVGAALLIRTRDLSHPSWEVKFDRYLDFFSSNKNYAEAVDWTNRFTAFMRT